MKTRALILAAGKGTRMKSDLPKVLHELNDKTMIEHVTVALEIPEIEKIGIIVSDFSRSGIEQVLGNRAEFITQTQQLGTGHAVLSAQEWVNSFEGNLIVVVGDAPLITKELMQYLIIKHEKKEAACTLLSAVWEHPPPYGRVVRDEMGKMLRIVEVKDASDAEREIKEVSSSHYCFNAKKMLSVLHKIDNNNAQGEYYLPDVIEILQADGEIVEALPVDDPYLTYGINSPFDLKRANFYINGDGV